jgi:hypothetical protein
VSPFDESTVAKVSDEGVKAIELLPVALFEQLMSKPQRGGMRRNRGAEVIDGADHSGRP